MLQVRRFSLFSLLVCLFVAIGCNNANDETKDAPIDESGTAQTQSPSTVAIPSFDADSAYLLIEKQVSFGPRVPGTDAQTLCAAWMKNLLEASCDTVYTQQVEVVAGNGKKLPCINLIGVINPSATNRILLLTHWDSRPWADQDTKDVDKPILAADDGGSGTAVLLQLAIHIKQFGLPQSLGVDILLTDVEDYGKEEWGDKSYCLGTQYWATNAHVPGYKASFGILLDMVGGKGAQFPMEAGSARMAGDVLRNMWQAAADAGYSSWFSYLPGPEITDDHVTVNKITGIKTIDIIHLTSSPVEVFPAYWHTHADNMDIIDKNTLKAVGQSLLQLLYTTAQPI